MINIHIFRIYWGLWEIVAVEKLRIHFVPMLTCTAYVSVKSQTMTHEDCISRISFTFSYKTRHLTKHFGVIFPANITSWWHEVLKLSASFRYKFTITSLNSEFTANTVVQRCHWQFGSGQKWLEKCAKLVHISQKWCAEFAHYAHRIFNYFGAEFRQP